MKAGIFYYSFSGNTKKVAEMTVPLLAARHYEVYINKIEPRYEASTFTAQCAWALCRYRTGLVNFYQPETLDLLIVGTPVWAFNPAPPVVRFLKQLKPSVARKALLIVTYGSGVGKERCVQVMEEWCRKKSIPVREVLYIQEKLLRHPEKLTPLVTAALEKAHAA